MYGRINEQRLHIHFDLINEEFNSQFSVINGNKLESRRRPRGGTSSQRHNIDAFLGPGQVSLEGRGPGRTNCKPSL